MNNFNIIQEDLFEGMPIFEYKKGIFGYADKKNNTLWMDAVNIQNLFKFQKVDTVTDNHLDDFVDQFGETPRDLRGVFKKAGPALIPHYSLDYIVWVGFRSTIKNNNIISFRKEAFEILSDHWLKGYSFNKEIFDKGFNAYGEDVFQQFEETVAQYFIASKIYPDGDYLAHARTIALVERDGRYKLDPQEIAVTKEILNKAAKTIVKEFELL